MVTELIETKVFFFFSIFILTAFKLSEWSSSLSKFATCAYPFKLISTFLKFAFGVCAKIVVPAGLSPPIVIVISLTTAGLPWKIQVCWYLSGRVSVFETEVLAATPGKKCGLKVTVANGVALNV